MSASSFAMQYMTILWLSWIVVMSLGEAADVSHPHRTDSHHHHHHHADKHHDNKYAIQHTCIHDELSDRIPTLAPKQHRTVTRRGQQAQSDSYGPIRFSVFSLDLTNESQCCSSVGQSAPDFRTGNNVVCTANDILTSEKRSILLSKILPAALDMLSERISVEIGHDNLILSGPNPCGNQVTVPSTHTTIGIPLTDFAVYVSAGPIASVSGSYTTTMAFASTCQVDPEHHKPLAGKINFNPRFIAWHNDSVRDNATVRVAVHELIHALGFSQAMFTYLDTVSSGLTPLFSSVARAKTVTKLRSPTLLQVARTYFNCSTLDGVELEDQGGSGTAGSHWERRNLKQELMAGLQDQNLFSPFTMAVFEDFGFYKMNFSASESMTWGKKSGCNFLEEPCNTTIAGLGREFCDTVDNSQLFCSFGNIGIGNCALQYYSSPLPTSQQYYGKPNLGGISPLMDYCGVVEPYSNLLCNQRQNFSADDPLADSRLGFYFGSHGRCAAASADFGSDGVQYDVTLRCLKMRCPMGTSLEISIGGMWHACPADGSEAVIQPKIAAGFSGTITCPRASEVCDSELFYIPPAASTSTTSTTTTSLPSTTATTVATATTTQTITSPPPTTMSTVSNPTTAQIRGSTTVAPTVLTTNAPTKPTLEPTTPEPSSPLVTLCRISFSCTPTGVVQIATRKTSEAALRTTLIDDVSIFLDKDVGFIDNYGFSVLPMSSAVVILIGINGSAFDSPLHQKSNVTRWNTTLLSPTLAGGTTALVRTALSSSNIQIKATGFCALTRVRPDATTVATGQLTISGTANFTRLIEVADEGALNASLSADISHALGVESRFVTVVKVMLTAHQTALSTSYEVVQPAGLLLASPVSEWKSQVSAILQSGGLNTTAALYRNLVAPNHTMGIAALELAAPPPVLTSPPSGSPMPSTSPSPSISPVANHSAPDLDDHCVLSKYPNCVWIEIAVACTIFVIVVVFLWRCYARSVQRHQMLLLQKKEQEEHEMRRAHREHRSKVKEHLSLQLDKKKYHEDESSQEETHASAPYMINLDENPFGFPTPPPAQKKRHDLDAPPLPVREGGGGSAVPGKLHMFQQHPAADRYEHKNRKTDELDDIL